MSKKLLMNSGGLMPVQDGLICWLDGRDGKNGDTVWKDRSGNGNDFIITDCIFNQNNIVFNSNSSSIVSNNHFFNPIVHQVELKLVFTKSHFISKNWFFYASNNSDFIWETSYYWVGASASPYCLIFNNSNFHRGECIIAPDIEILINFRLVEKNSIDLFINGKYSTRLQGEHGETKNYFSKVLIGRKYEYVSGLKVGSAKFYNRTLTEEEIRQNYLYEQSIQRG